MKSLLLLIAAAALMNASDTVPVEGNAASQVRVIIYEDLQCPDCADFRKLLDDGLLVKYGAKVAFEHRDFPLPKHAWARKAAIASRVFAGIDPQLYVEWRRYALSHIREIKAETFADRLLAWAREHGVDPAKVQAGLDDKRLNEAVDRDFNEGVARGVSKTPTVFVDGEPFVETIPLEEISAALDKAIK